MIEALETNRVDIVVTGIWPTSTRGKRANFTKPIYYSTVRAYVRADDTRFDGALKQINNPEVRIATIDGEMTSIIASMDFPVAQTVALPQTSDVSQVLLEIVTNKADITFVEPAVAKAYIANNRGTIREVANVPPLRVFPNVMMVGINQFEFLSMINVAIGELLNNGFVDKVIDKYEKYPGSFQKVALPYRPN